MSGASRAAAAAAERYRAYAGAYDAVTGVFTPWRRWAVEQLGLRPGQVVLDVGCGTGLCFPALEAGVGPSGGIVGIEPSHEMWARAARRVEEHGWGNVTLVAAPAEEAAAPVPADAALFCATHEVLQSEAALGNVLRHLRAGARVVAIGGKWGSPWWSPVNAATFWWHWPWVARFDGFDQPWAHLARLVPDHRVADIALGGGYLFTGTVDPAAAT